MKINFCELSIYNVKSLQEDILKELKICKKSFDLDFEEVTTIDLNFIQLLISLKKSCDEKNLHLNVLNIKSRQMKQIFKTLNLNTFLGIQ